MMTLAIIATAAQRWCPWCGDHMGWGMWAMMFFWLIVLVVVLGVAWAAATGRWRGGTRDARDPAEEKLRDQFARGEIDDETYRRRLDELRRS